ncbi:transporter, partial [Acidithiobacillus ferridurans]|nr:transporter [Acidithiobacillus ferridurans]
METIVWGFMFGAILQYARLNRFNTIAGMAVLQNLAVAKTMAFTIGLGMLLLQSEILLGWADYH